MLSLSRRCSVMMPSELMLGFEKEKSGSAIQLGEMLRVGKQRGRRYCGWKIMLKCVCLKCVCFICQGEMPQCCTTRHDVERMMLHDSN